MNKIVFYYKSITSALPVTILVLYTLALIVTGDLSFLFYILFTIIFGILLNYLLQVLVLLIDRKKNILRDQVDAELVKK